MRRVFSLLTITVLFGMLAVPLATFGIPPPDTYGDLFGNSFRSLRDPAVSNLQSEAEKAIEKFHQCADEELGGLSNVKEAVEAVKKVKAEAERTIKAVTTGGLSELFGGGGEDQVKILQKICDEAKKQVQLEKKKIADQKKQRWSKKLSAVAFKNAITVLFTRAAHHAALKIASALPGRKSAIRSTYDLKNELDAFAGEVLDQSLRNVWGRSLCEPLTPFAKVNLEIITRRFVEPPRPKCSWWKIRRNIRDSFQNIESYQDILDLRSSLNPSGNDLGAILTIATDLKVKVAQEEANKRIQQIVGEGFKDYTSRVTGLIKTPSSVIRDTVDEYVIRNGKNPYLVYTGEAAADAVGVFTNTLIQKVLERYVFKQGLNPEADIARSGGVSDIFSLGIQTLNAAVQRFASIFTPDLRTGSRTDVVEVLDATDRDSPYGCVIDAKFRSALEHDPPLTLEQATAGASPFLSPSLIVGSHGLGRGKNDTLCDDPTLLSLRSIRILRKYRVVPVGWELAAEYIAERASFDRRTREFTLNEVMREYANPASPFYMLVDPAWVLKAPEVFVRRQGYGEVQADADDDSFARRYGPVDEQSCIQEKRDGSCARYGYCIEEKPLWRINGEECQAQFNTCTTYTSRTGRSVSLLSNSLDHDVVCSAPEAVGCRKYCAFDSATGDFRCSGNTAPSPLNRFGSMIYLNASALSCSAGAAGCNEYLILRNKDTGAPLNQAELQPIVSAAISGDYTSGDPLSKTDGGYYSHQALVQRIFLKGEVQECAPEFAGCDLYTPLEGNEPAIPAIIGSQCLAKCVGYRSFKEGYSYFDNPSAPWPAFNPKPGTVDFIPSLAQSCRAQAAGCEEFTNLEDVSAGGEQKEYFTYLRACEKPGAYSDQAVFYTWEGSDTAGFQLKEWFLKVDPRTGGPAGSACSPEEADPNHPAYNPDCRTFYNTSAQTFPVYQSSTTFVSEECTQYRRTKDGTLWFGMKSQATPCSASENLCLQYKGSTANNVRMVKLGGGSMGAETFDKAPSCGSGDSATICGWSAPPSALSSESIVAGGKSLLVNGSVRTTSPLNLREGAVYELSFWAKGSASGVGTDTVGADVVTSSGRVSFSLGRDNVTSDDWVYLRALLVDPGYLTVAPDSDSKTYLEIYGSGSFFIDNIVLRETPDSVYFIQNSWEPSMPRDDATGIPLCDATQIGCQAYQDSRGQTVSVTEFASLCPLSAVGCVAAVDTKNSSKTVATNVRGVSTPADSVIHVIDNPKAYCQPEEKGCVRLGMDDRNSNREPKFTNMYKVVDPDRYEKILCLAEQEYCESFTTEQGVGAAVFKDPTHFICEFKVNVSPHDGARAVSGWFVRGTNMMCPTLTAPQSGVVGRCFGGKSKEDPFGNTCSSNDACTNHASPGKAGFCVSTSFTSTTVTPESTSNFAGSHLPFGALCPSDQSSCFELQDPQEPRGCDRTLLFGEVPSNARVKGCYYYYYLSNSLASSGCEKQNPDEGCVGFWDTSRVPTFSSSRQCLNANGTPVFPAIQCRIDAECETGRCGYP